MTLGAEVAYSASNTANAITKIKDVLVSMGWSAYDDQYTADDYYVLKTQGEGDVEMPFYVQIMHVINADKITIRAWAWWNNTTHEGLCRLGVQDSEHYMNADDDANFYLWIYGNKDWVSLITKVGTAYQARAFGNVKRFWTVEGTLQSDVTAGSDVVLTLGVNEASDFIVGKSYQIVGANGEGRQPVTVTAKGTNTITVESLSYAFNANSRVGQTPYPWLLMTLQQQAYVYWLRQGISGTGSEAYDNYYDYNVFDYAYLNGDFRGNQRYALFPVMYKEYNQESIFGYRDDLFMRASGPTSSEDTMSVGNIDSGDVTSSPTTTTLSDTTKSWSTNAHADKAVIITAGTGAGQIRKIVSNTDNQLTISSAWIILPDNTSEYIICDEAWRYFYLGSAVYSAAFKEVG